ncbi:SUMF1/EgtB/PvdO family nonheme iron enzyme [Shewanella sp.]|uniref:formylglycine-generating enzyme family protein n=1 Tax=Shewanella sp. TaxID=50422 RepID=UPI0025848B73|nr:SUMF1/EgtB/PvdO family nonheme iron enzyme [Shewanella sp.]MCJ8305351.1 formylglycine-generating enzyme family protein [Shewanella sp.]
MRFYRLNSLTLGLMTSLILTACGAGDLNPPLITSSSVPDDDIKSISAKIEASYPKIDKQLKLQILDVAVKSMEDMVWIEGGSFIMGDIKAPCNTISTERMDWTPEATCYSVITSRETGAIYQHKVTLDSYSLAKYETTHYGADAYRLTHGLELYRAEVRAKRKGFAQQIKNKPSPTRRWQEAKDYCLWLGDLTGYKFDLPTEAQWEYAARNRGKNIYYATNNGYVQRVNGDYYVPELGHYVDFTPEEVNYGSGRSEVGSWPANPLGIYDLSGNMNEWVNDWYSADYYQNSPEDNPQGPATGADKVVRGILGGGAVVTARTFSPIVNEYTAKRGFRCALQQSTPAVK